MKNIVPEYRGSLSAPRHGICNAWEPFRGALWTIICASATQRACAACAARDAHHAYMHLHNANGRV